MSPSVDVVMSSDTAFLPYTAATIASILQNYRDSRPLRIFLLVNEPFGAEDWDRFQSLNSIRNFSFAALPVHASEFATVRTGSNISVATYSRLFMHELLPSDCRRALYLDSDLLVRECVSALYDLQLDDSVLFAGAEDARGLRELVRAGLSASGRYINAGVMLVNLALMRNIEFLEMVRSHVAEHGSRITLGDQQIINEAFQDKIAYFPLRWNLHWPFPNKKWVRRHLGSANRYSLADVEAAVSHPAIVHFNGARRKPWESLSVGWTREWLDCLRLTPYIDEVQAARPPLPAQLWRWLRGK